MKILHINTYDKGGAAKAAIRLHYALLKEGIDSYMLFLYKSDFSIPNSIEYERFPYRKPYIIEKVIDKVLNKLSPKRKKYFVNYIKLKNKPEGFEIFSFNPTDYDITTQNIYKDCDIVHLNWVAGFVDFRFYKKNIKPVIWTLHDMNPFTGGCHYSNDCEKYKSSCNDCPQLKGTVDTDNALYDQEFKSKYLKFKNVIITSPSKWLGNCSSKSKLFKNFIHKHYTSSLDLSIFKPHDQIFCRTVLNLPKDDIIFLFVSDSIENKRKGFDLLIGALSKLKNEHIHICAIGEKKDNISYPNNITFLGKFSDERLMAIAYSAADAFILPSREDNLPNVMLESFACGIPVIGFKIGGVVEHVINNITGLLASEISDISLAVSINRFLVEKDKFNKEIIRKYAEDTFNQKGQAMSYINCYSDMLNK